MRGAVIAVAVLLYAASVAIFGAGLRLTVPTAGGDAVPRPKAREPAREQPLKPELETEPAAVASPGTITAEGVVARLGGNLIGPGGVALTPAARNVLLRLLQDLRVQPGTVVVVEGHTDGQPVRDPTGRTYRDNVELSVQRARAVAEVLTEGGVPERLLAVKGWGDTRPLAGNDTAEGRERNRRVEIRLLPAGQRP